MFKVLKNDAAVGQVTMPDFEKEAARLLEEARAETRRILAAARSEAAAIKETARKEGYAAGLARGGEIGIEEGRRKAHEEAQALLAERSAVLARALEELRKQVADLRGSVASKLKTDALELLLSSAEYLARCRLEVDRLAVVPVLDDAVDFVTSRPARVFVNPDDLDDLGDLAPDLLERFRPPDWELVPDASMGHGDVRIEHPEGRIEAGFNDRLAVLRRALLGREDAGAV